MSRAALAERARRLALRVNGAIEAVAVGFLGLLVANVLAGIALRAAGGGPLGPLTFTEELARYATIWVALLAVSGGIVHREHVGLTGLADRLGPRVRRWTVLAAHLGAVVFFATLAVTGIGFVERGFGRVTMIGAMPKAVPYAIVPLAATLAAVQAGLAAAEDWARPEPRATVR
jgi:TRAP-type C4-dicarboxylate transport system permease small subunit